MICKIEGCTNQIKSDSFSGFCQVHRGFTQNQCGIDGCEAYLTGGSTGPCPKHRPVCIVDECETPLRADNTIGYCRPHRDLSPDRKAAQHENYILNREDRIKGHHENYLLNREDRIKNAVVWRKNNPERFKEINLKKEQTRRARKANGFVELIDLFSVWCRDAGLCFLCGFPADKTNWWLEHVVPLSRGGEHSYANVAVSHSECNRRKHNKLLEEFMLEEKSNL